MVGGGGILTTVSTEYKRYGNIIILSLNFRHHIVKSERFRRMKPVFLSSERRNVRETKK